MNKTNEELAWLRVLFSLSAVFDASLWAWLVQRYDTAPLALLVFVAVTACILVVVCAVVAIAAIRRLSVME